ncbi:hypothetical protein D3C80_1807750 [compost metagenome]
MVGRIDRLPRRPRHGAGHQRAAQGRDDGAQPHARHQPPACGVIGGAGRLLCLLRALLAQLVQASRRFDNGGERGFRLAVVEIGHGIAEERVLLGLAEILVLRGLEQGIAAVDIGPARGLVLGHHGALFGIAL